MKKRDFVELHRCEYGEHRILHDHVSCRLCYDEDYEVYEYCLSQGIKECVENEKAREIRDKIIEEHSETLRLLNTGSKKIRVSR